MHSLFFDVKRAHRATLKLMNPLLARVGGGLTQARYDVLHAVARLATRSRRRQSDLWRALGLHPSTVSKLVRSLVRLGFLQVRRDSFDRRQVVVRLSEAGGAILVRARRFLWKFVHKEVGAALVRPGARDAGAQWMELEGFLVRFRMRFGCRATLLYDPAWPPGAE